MFSAHVEGNYEEIVQWLDDQQGQGVTHSQSHGSYIRDEYGIPLDRLNWGIFSIVDDFKYCDDDTSHENCVPSGTITLEDWDRETEWLGSLDIQPDRQYENWR